MTRIRKIAVSCAVCVATLALALVAAGCSSNAAGTVNAVLDDAPPVMPVGHEGRYQDLGVEGCYGCHGTNSAGKTMMTKATALPASHLSVTTAQSADDILTTYSVCITCHVPESAATAAAVAALS